MGTSQRNVLLLNNLFSFMQSMQWVRNARSICAVMVICTARLVVSQNVLPLPSMRSIGQPPSVTRVGEWPAVRGTTVAIPLTAMLAISDLTEFDYQLGGVFPRSVDYYPADSIRAIKRDRAADWIARLSLVRGPGVEGEHLIDLAAVAMRAEQDTMAWRLLDARISALPPSNANRTARSFALAAAVHVLTSGDQDSARLARNVARASAYNVQLMAIPSTGYAMVSDSTDVLYRKITARLELAAAFATIRATERMRTEAYSALALLATLGVEERWDMMWKAYPYREVASAFLAVSRNPRSVDSLNAAILTALAPHPQDGSRLADPQDLVALRNRFASVALIGQHAPAIQAHAWINTADSTYADTPRTRTFADGLVHVLVVGDNDTPLLPLLERLHRQFNRGVEVMLVTNTNGFIWPDVASPQAEVAWLTNYYHTKRHLTVPIAMWAGAKHTSGYGWSIPAPSPARAEYHADGGNLEGIAIVVDGQGIIREYDDFRSRQDEMHVGACVRALLAESQHSTGGH